MESSADWFSRTLDGGIAVPAGWFAKPYESRDRIPILLKRNFRFSKTGFRFTKMDISVDFFFRAHFGKMGFRPGRGRLAKVLK